MPGNTRSAKKSFSSTTAPVYCSAQCGMTMPVWNKAAPARFWSPLSGWCRNVLRASGCFREETIWQLEFPEQNGRAGRTYLLGNGNDASNTDVHLGYEGKKSREEILRASPAVCRQLWPEHHDQTARNRLYFGDNLPILAALARHPVVCGKIRLIYIDPPYATRSVFQSRNQT